MVVDDDEPLRDLVRLILESGGCLAKVADGGDEALERLNSQGADLDAVILDLSMPDVTGVQVYQAMQELHSSVPVVIVSGTPRHETLRLHPDLTHLPYIEKPFAC